MARILITYDSVTGNTEKMALAVAEGVEKVDGAKAQVKRIAETKDLDLLRADAIVIGSPTYYGQMSAATKGFIDKTERIHGKLRGKIGAAFTSSGGTASGAETTLLSVLGTMLVHGMIIQGRYDDKHYGAVAVGSPSKTELQDCRQLGKMVAELALRLKK